MNPYYPESLACLTDLYQLLMAAGYLKAGLDKKEAVFHLFFRKKPFNGGFAIAAGLEAVVQFIERFKFDESDLKYLSTLKDADGINYFDSQFLKYLSDFKLNVSLDAVPEGTPVFPFEPLIRVQGPLIACQLLESPLLNLINFPTLIATKAARIRTAAQNDTVMEFGLRRAQGIDGALTASRSAYIGGCDSTSNVLAGKFYGIPVKGTHAHSWVMVFEEEEEAFKAYAESAPGNTIFLVDTYDTITGVEKACEVGRYLKSKGRKFLGIRLDSGDLSYLSIKAREILDQNGFKEAVIVASNELDETIITELKRQGAQITVWGVGTNLVTSANQPALDGVYKLSAIRDPGGEWVDKLKLSEQLVKVSNPGILQVRRFMQGESYQADCIFDIKKPIPPEPILVDPFDPTRQKKIPPYMQWIDLLEPVFKEGKRVYDLPPLHEIRFKTQNELKHFHDSIKRFLNPHQYVVGMEENYYNDKVKLIRKIRSQKNERLNPR